MGTVVRADLFLGRVKRADPSPGPSEQLRVGTVVRAHLFLLDPGRVKRADPSPGLFRKVKRADPFPGLWEKL